MRICAQAELDGEDGAMSEPLRIDTHIHLYSLAPGGRVVEGGLRNLGYGQARRDRLQPDTGTLGETVAALGRGGFAHGVVMNLFSADLFRLQYESALPPEADAAERARALAQFDATIGERYVAFNRWLMDTLADTPTISGFRGHGSVGALAGAQCGAPARDGRAWRARGGLHPVVQKFEANDRACTRCTRRASRWG